MMEKALLWVLHRPLLLHLETQPILVYILEKYTKQINGYLNPVKNVEIRAG